MLALSNFTSQWVLVICQLLFNKIYPFLIKLNKTFLVNINLSFQQPIWYLRIKIYDKMKHFCWIFMFQYTQDSLC